MSSFKTPSSPGYIAGRINDEVKLTGELQKKFRSNWQEIGFRPKSKRTASHCCNTLLGQRARQKASC